MTRSFVPHAATLSFAITVLAPSIAAAQTPVSIPLAEEAAQARVLGAPAFARLVPGTAVRIATSELETTQGPMASPENVKRAVGTQVRVTSMNGSKRNGTLVSLSASEVVLRTRDGEAVMPLTQVQKVEKVTHRVLVGVLIGLGAGAGVGAAIGGPGVDMPEWVIPLFCVGGGIGAGALVGREMNADARTLAGGDVIYDAGRSTVQVAPILSQRRAGLALAVRW